MNHYQENYRSISALYDREKLIKLDLLTAVFIHHGHDLSNLLSVFYQAQGNERVLKFIHTDSSRAILIQRIEVAS
jgi:hypothetical protein